VKSAFMVLRIYLLKVLFPSAYRAIGNLGKAKEGLDRLVTEAVDEPPAQSTVYVLVRASTLTEVIDAAYGTDHPLAVRHREKLRIANACAEEAQARQVSKVLN